MGGGYPIPVEPQGPSNHGRSSRRHLNLPDSNPLTSNPEVANPFRPDVFRFPISNPPPMANPPPVANPPPLANLPLVTNAEHDDPFGLTDEELNWAYDYTFAQLQFGGLRIEEGYHRSVANTPILPKYPPPSNPPHVENPSQTQELPSWDEGYETDPGAEYEPPLDEEMLWEP
ncbi:hypothetical protein HanRHA438_Chr08g0330971 [Helianthus annuus]|nr:hypothetical protein HanOQP8_Chr08g0270681 [Helianthus annuus]KAJ0721033.1 hypothetical protein HanOQP8_Chr08g0270691 [Helianthus annuus]KAJ0896134.1 hypothetical protein HanRHA438_Chr08g0330971 [Helianthus annuus]